MSKIDYSAKLTTSLSEKLRNSFRISFNMKCQSFRALTKRNDVLLNLLSAHSLLSVRHNLWHSGTPTLVKHFQYTRYYVRTLWPLLLEFSPNRIILFNANKFIKTFNLLPFWLTLIQLLESNGNNSEENSYNQRWKIIFFSANSQFSKQIELNLSKNYEKIEKCLEFLLIRANVCLLVGVRSIGFLLPFILQKNPQMSIKSFVTTDSNYYIII